MIIELLHEALGQAPQGYEVIEYVFAFFLLLLGLFLVYFIIASFFKLFRAGKR